MEGGRLKRSPQLVEGKDYVMVPEPVWRALYHWYGANLSLPRPVSCDFRHFLTTKFIQGHEGISSSHLLLHPEEQTGKEQPPDGNLWLLSWGLLHTARGSCSRAEVLLSCWCLLKHTKVKLSSVLKACHQNSHQLKSCTMKSETPATLRICSFSLTISRNGGKATHKHNLQTLGKSSKGESSKENKPRTLQSGCSGAPGSCRILLSWKYWELLPQFLLSVFVPQSGWFVPCQVVPCKRCT